MNKLIILFSVTTAILSAGMQFSSNEVKSEGNQISLKGNVFIKHDLGTIAAEEAILTQGAHHGDSSLLSACLKSCVEIQFSSNQTLHSENATIDFEHHTASLSSDDKEIFFFDPDRKITIQSKQIECEWDQVEKKPMLTSLSADHSVQVSFGSDVFLYAENATYAPSDGEAGILKLNNNVKDTPCIISIGDDLLTADHATIDMEEETLILHRPIGKVSANLINSTLPEIISFTSKFLSWNRKTGEISLSEQILIDGNSFGHLIAHDSVSFSTEKIDEKILFKGFSATGESKIVTDQGMKISCDGNIDFDYDRKKLTASGKESPILYQNGNLVIESNKITLDQLQGTPKIISFFDHVSFSAGSMIGNAGGLTYRPDEHSLEFFSTKEENVVFYNKESDTKMCADAITITRDPENQDNIIRGHGIVKLIFDYNNREQIIEVLNSCVKQPF